MVVPTPVTVVKSLMRLLLSTFQRKRCAEARLLQSTLENIGEGLSVFDGRGRLIAWNSRFCELLELPPDLPVGAPLRDILMLQAARGDFGRDDPSAEVAKRLEAFYRDVPTRKERVTPRGRILQISRRATPDGAIVSVYSDVTDLKASERKLIQARSQAETANHAKSEFLANMSHELRTPLNAIIGFSEIIAHELFGPLGNEKYLDYMKDIHQSSLHLLSIINDVLDMSKIEAGKLELSKEPLNIRHLIGEVVRMMRERAESRSIELVTKLSDGEVEIWADERAMKQIFLNLLSNAIKFSRDGSEVYVRVVSDEPGLAVVEFEDHGIGMNREELERALQPFGQAKPSTTRNYGGTGLGLPITKGLIEAHGGKLAIESRAGQGTTARISLPTERKPLLAGA
jgi:signal transduction histidine kinase